MRHLPDYEGVLFLGQFMVEGPPLHTSDINQVLPALERTTGAGVVVKILDGAEISPEMCASFEQTSKVICGLDHPSVVRGLGYGRHEGRPFVVMARLEGASLQEILEEYGELSVGWATTLMMTALEGLEVLHGLGVVHRDVTPLHLFLAEPGTDAERLVVTGLGCATVFEGDGRWSAQEPEGVVVGDPAYLAPEYLRDRALSPAVDVYQAALTLGAMVAGVPMVPGKGVVDTAPRHLMGDLDVPFGVSSSAVGPVVQKALSRDPEARHASAGELLGALRRASRMSQSGIGVIYEDVRTISAGFPGRLREVRDRRTGDRAFALSLGAVSVGVGLARAIDRTCDLHARIQHPSLAQVLFRDNQPDRVEVVLQGAPGRLLSVELAQSRRMTVQRATRLVCGLLGALAKAHRSGVVHGGLTTDAVWLARPAQADERLILLGFWTPVWSEIGWSDEAADARIPSMSPEMFGFGRLGPQSDVYQAALLLLEMISGREAGGWSDGDGLLDLPESLAGGPVASAVLGGLSREVARRHPDAGAFKAALERAMLDKED